MGMQVYVKRGLGGGIKYGVDKMAKTTKQYEPYYLESSFNMNNNPGGTHDEETFTAGGAVDRTFGQRQTTRNGYQKSKGPSLAD